MGKIHNLYTGGLFGWFSHLCMLVWDVGDGTVPNLSPNSPS